MAVATGIGMTEHVSHHRYAAIAGPMCESLAVPHCQAALLAHLHRAVRARTANDLDASWIVPVVTAGTHEQFVVLRRGDQLARRLHPHRWARTEVLPIVLSLPWGLTPGFLPYLPLPAQTTVSFLPAMRWPELGPANADVAVDLERCYREVEAAMQAEMDRITHGRRWLLGQRITRPPDAIAIPPRETPAARDRAGRDAAAIRASSSR
jgi:hypothetical protein